MGDGGRGGGRGSVPQGEQVLTPGTAESNSGDGSRARRRPAIQSLDRGLVILELVTKSVQPVSLSELAELFGIDRSSAFRLADTLKRRGFLGRPRNSSGYVPGPSMWGLVQAYNWNRTLVKTARPHLRWLASQTKESAHLAIREDAEALFIDNVPGKHLITVGEMVPLYCTAHGKALLADHNAEQLRALLGKRPLKAYTPHTMTSVDKLSEVCALIRSQGFVIDESEYYESFRCVAAPVRDCDGSVIGSIGISAPAIRMPEELFGFHADLVVEAAQRITLSLGTAARRDSAARKRERLSR
jgi:IclR family transcriptional regulator, acetate operon repressor